MSTRTLTLTNTRYQLDGVTPIVGEQEYVYLQTPGGFPVTDLEGRVYFDGQPWGQSPKTDGSGVWTTTDVYPGDLRSGNGNQLVTPAQLVILEGGAQKTLSPPGFVYAASITVRTWYPTATGNASGMLPMILDLALLDTTPAIGFPVLYTLSTSADAPDGRSYLGGVPIPESSNVNGISLITLWPTSLLDPIGTAYLAQLPDASGTVWKFTVPTVPTGYVGAYNAGATYFKGDGTMAGAASVVLWTDGLYYQYVNVTAAAGHDPTNTAYWQLWPGEPLIWHRTEISGQGIPRIDTTGVRQSPTLTTLIDDPVSSPGNLDDNLRNLAARTGAALRTVSTTASLDAVTDDWLIVDATSGAFNLTFPAVSARSRPFWLLKKDAAHTVTFVRAGSDTFNGATSFSLTTQYQWAVVKPDTAHGAWYVQTGGAGTSAITTEGDVEVGDSSGVAARLPIGNQHYGLASIGTDPVYLSPAGGAGGALPLRNEGDVLYRKLITTTTATVGSIGDSITAGTVGGGGSGAAPPVTCATALSIGGLTVTANNQGITSLSSWDWQPGSTNLNNAKSAFSSAGVRIVHIMLGTNDQLTSVLTTPAQYYANMLAICNDLTASGYLVVLAFNPAIGLGTVGWGSGGSAAAANAQYLLYQQQLVKLRDHRTIFLGDTLAYEYFRLHTAELQADGVHPTSAGNTTLGGLWADALLPLVRSLYGHTSLAALPAGSNGQVLTLQGGYPAWQNNPAGFANPLSAQDDLMVGGASGSPTRLGKGADGTVLTIDPVTHHVTWDAPTTGFADPTTTKGDLLAHGSVTARLGVGTDGQVLTADSTQTLGMKWGDAPVHVPLVTGDTPGPVFIVTGDGQCVLT